MPVLFQKKLVKVRVEGGGKGYFIRIHISGWDYVMKVALKGEENEKYREYIARKVHPDPEKPGMAWKSLYCKECQENAVHTSVNTRFYRYQEKAKNARPQDLVVKASG